MQGDLKRGLLIRNEMASKNYSSEFILNLMREEGKGVFTARLNTLGHIQQVNFIFCKILIHIHFDNFLFKIRVVHQVVLIVF